MVYICLPSLSFATQNSRRRAQQNTSFASNVLFLLLLHTFLLILTVPLQPKKLMFLWRTYLLSANALALPRAFKAASKEFNHTLLNLKAITCDQTCTKISFHVFGCFFSTATKHAITCLFTSSINVRTYLLRRVPHVMILKLPLLSHKPRLRRKASRHAVKIRVCCNLQQTHIVLAGTT